MYRGKVSTLSTVLIISNLSVYKTVYKFLKVSTSLIANDLSVNINVNGAAGAITHKNGATTYCQNSNKLSVFPVRRTLIAQWNERMTTHCCGSSLKNARKKRLPRS
jgi:hypothetical protein